MIYPALSYPTAIRATGVGFSRALSGIGSALALFILPLLQASLGTQMFWVVSLAAIIPIFFLLAVRHEPTREDIDAAMNKEQTMTLLSTGTDYDALAAAFRPIFTRIAQGAAEREQQRILPDEPIRWLKEAGFGTLRIPREKGGWGASLPQLSALLIELAQADSNLPQALRAHFAFVEDQLNQPDSAGRDRWFRRFLDGELVGSGWTEIGAVKLGR
jgi:alkylation response protein AidB-like acyl-CoA dehydrogenase